ncbi:hypothetical protein DD599_26430 [Enterobacter cloacae complex sp. CH23B]|nr:hypothetical protein DD599_26430 [Enterobacter cloacae complex sp. CH23B]
MELEVPLPLIIAWKLAYANIESDILLSLLFREREREREREGEGSALGKGGAFRMKAEETL